jgi:hypothetical protein
MKNGSIYYEYLPKLVTGSSCCSIFHHFGLDTHITRWHLLSNSSTLFSWRIGYIVTRSFTSRRPNEKNCSPALSTPHCILPSLQLLTSSSNTFSSSVIPGYYLVISLNIYSTGTYVGRSCNLNLIREAKHLVIVVSVFNVLPMSGCLSNYYFTRLWGEFCDQSSVGHFCIIFKSNISCVI